MKVDVVATAVAAALLAGIVVAAPAPSSAPTAAPLRPASLEQAVKQVQDRTQGHILAADSMSRGRTEVYRIKVLKPDGKVEVMQLHSGPRSSGRSESRQPNRGGS